MQVSPEAEIRPLIQGNNETVTPSAHEQQQQQQEGGDAQQSSRGNALTHGAEDDGKIEPTGADQMSNIEPDGERRAPAVIDDRDEIRPVAGPNQL